VNFADRYFEQKIAHWAKTERGVRAGELAGGMAADFADYRYRAGYIAALDDLLVTLQAVEREMSAAPDRQERQ